jgi:hypothetical protein
VYKLVEIGGVPRIKLSHEVAKVMLPGQKRIYRIFKPSGEPLVSGPFFLFLSFFRKRFTLFLSLPLALVIFLLFLSPTLPLSLYL